MSQSGAAFMSTTLVPTPLPPNPYDPLTHPTPHAAFNSCLPLERASTWADLSRSPQPSASSPEFGFVMLQTSPQVAGRTLGYALVHAPSDAGRDRVAREIAGCGDDPELLAGLAHVCVFGLIRIFMNLNGPAPMEESPRFPSGAVLWDDDDVDEEEQPAELELPAGMIPKSLTKKLLRRDRHRCVFTDKVDIESLERGDVDVDLSAHPAAHGLGGGSYLGVAHIVSQPLSGPGSEGIGGMTEAAQGKLCWASSPAAVLDWLAGIDVESMLPNLDTNHPANTFVADHAPHVVFDRLEMWLTHAVDADGNVLADTYDTHMQRPLMAPFIGVRPQVHFRHHTTPGPDVDGVVAVPPPSRTLLGIHASCAQIAHLSGAAGVLRDFYQGEDRYYGPASALGRQDTFPESAAADELMHALRRAQVG